jgi:hypothetical protein
MDRLFKANDWYRGFGSTYGCSQEDVPRLRLLVGKNRRLFKLSFLIADTHVDLARSFAPPQVAHG